MPSLNKLLLKGVDELGARIFLADDDIGALRITGTVLRKQGYSVSLFGNNDIVDAVIGQGPDLLVLGMSGQTRQAKLICRRLKSDQRTNHIPILLSGKQVHLKNLVDSVEHGADGYFIKPFKTDELLAKIKAFIRLKTTHQNLIRTNALLERQEKKLTKQNKELKARCEISRDLTRCLELDTLLKVIFNKSRELLKADKCFLQLVSGETEETMEIIGTGTESKELKVKPFYTEKEKGLAWKIIKQKIPIPIPRTKASPLINKAFAYSHDLKHALFVPLVGQGKVVGVLLICREKPKYFTQEQIELAQILGSEATISIEKARIYEETKDSRSILEAIVEWGDSGIIMVDKNCVVRAANRKFGELMGLNPDHIVGKNEIAGVIGKTKLLFKDPDFYEDRLKWLRAGRTTDVAKDYLEMVRPVPRALERFSGPVYDSSGELMGRLDIYHDVTVRKRSERRIKTLYRRERKIAQILQKNLLPKSVPEIAGYEIGSKYTAAVQGMVIGGDYFDFIYLNNDMLALAIGDVCGKGMAAAVQTYLVKYSLRAFAREDPDPAVVVSRLNWTFCQEVEEGAFVTLVYALLDHKKDVLQCCVAGHPQPIIYRYAKGDFDMITASGGIVGVVPESYYQSSIIRLQTDDIVVFYTDGIIEARSNRGFFGEKNLKKIINNHAGRGAQEISDLIFSAVKRFTSDNLSDDAAVVVLKKVV